MNDDSNEMMNTVFFICLSFSLILTIVRLLIAESVVPQSLSFVGSYQAVAHLFVGGLIGAWFVDRKRCQWAGMLALVLSVVEVFAAIYQRIV